MPDSKKIQREKRIKANKTLGKQINQALNTNSEIINELIMEIDAWKQVTGCKTPQQYIKQQPTKQEKEEDQEPLVYTDEYTRYLEFCQADFNSVPLPLENFQVRKQSLFDILQGKKNNHWTDNDIIEKFMAQDVLYFFIMEYNNKINDSPIIEKLVRIYNEVKK